MDYARVALGLASVVAVACLLVASVEHVEWELSPKTTSSVKRFFRPTMKRFASSSVPPSPLLFVDVAKVYYINLDDSTDRRDNMERQLASQAVPYERVPAVRGESAADLANELGSYVVKNLKDKCPGCADHGGGQKKKTKTTRPSAASRPSTPTPRRTYRTTTSPAPTKRPTPGFQKAAPTAPAST